MGNWYLFCKKGDFAAISEKFHITPMLARILINRDLKTDEEIDSFLHAGMESLHDPYLFKDMSGAVSITMDSIRCGRKIRVIGDYDMDGVCASTILKKFFEYMGADIDVRLPHRVLEGYGMNVQMAEDAAADNISLIITCDNGISSYDAVERANELGITVIVTDHHEPPAILPPASAIIDAKQSSCPYPYKELCGAAVCYKLCQAVITHIHENGFDFPAGRDAKGLEALLADLIQFAGMATIADIVALTGENRIFAREGIRILRNTNNPGLSALIDIKGIEREQISSYHIGFILSPCVNSAGRLEKAQIAFDLFDTDDPARAFNIAEELNELNEKRKNLTREQTDRAVQILEEEGERAEGEGRVRVIYLPEAHESIAGIIAGKLKEDHNCPVLIITDSEEGLKGSGRSTDDYNLIEALSRHPEMFRKFGGHAKAAGFTLNCTPKELSDVLNSEDEAKNICTDNRIWIDMQLPFRYLTEDFIDELGLLEPYGLMNDRPLFAEKNVDFRDIKIIGKNSNVLKMTLVNEDGDRAEGIYFGHGRGMQADDVMAAIAENGDDTRFSIIFRANINEFRNMRYPQAVIEEIQLS